MIVVTAASDRWALDVNRFSDAAVALMKREVINSRELTVIKWNERVL